MNQSIDTESPPLDQALQPRRLYNQWVANETLEDFALRHTARRARRWSFSRIANTALGTSSFLVLELLGATIAINYGVYHSLWAIAVVCTLLFLTGLPISYYATKYSVDIDLLTRGAGFGYIGSTISSLIYASFTFIFFALEAAIMASALELLLGVPMWLGYIVSALAVIPLVTYGITMISRFQLLTQPLWLLLQLAPIIYVAQHPQGVLQEWLHYPGIGQSSESQFSWVVFGTATTVLFALVAQIGEQVDFLRFLPEPDTSPKSREKKKWWAAIVIAGPGWTIFGAIKLVLGTLLAYLLLQQGFSPEDAANPTYMYQTAFGHFSLSPGVALVLAALFVIVCQIKINVANAYAGSLAWSNFFSRLTHHHPGRVVWLVFNVAIALLLMELGVYRAIETVLHHYSAFVLAWFGSIVADLVINKPLGLSPKHIEFKRSKLYDINPVGVGSTLLAAIIGIATSTGLFGDDLAAFSGFIALALPFITVPLIAVLTGGKYYLSDDEPFRSRPSPSDSSIAYELTDTHLPSINKEKENHRCTVCHNHFDREDVSFCPAYSGAICSLCCALESRCHDRCRPKAHFSAQLETLLKPFTNEKIYQIFTGPVGQFTFIFSIIASLALGIFYLAYFPFIGTTDIDGSTLQTILSNSYFLLLILIGVIVWLFVLAQKSTHMALQQTDMQTQKLSTEIVAHEHTLEQLERARKSADSANVAKSNYVTALSHELRTPLNVILGYAQLLQKDSNIPEAQQDNLSILHRNGEHLATMIEGLLEISKIEAGKLSLNADKVRLDLMLDQLVKMFRQQAESKGLTFDYSGPDNLPTTIKVDEKRLRQILINLLSNAIKFTETGGITFSVKYRGHVARFSISDTGYGIPEESLQDIFSPFYRGEDVDKKQIHGSGLGLAICRQLADMMGAEIDIKSTPGEGSTFTLLLGAAPAESQASERDSLGPIRGYQGEQKTILVVDDNRDHRKLLTNLLQPLGFNVLEAMNKASAQHCAANRPDLVLLDVRLANESGWDIAQWLREQFERLPIIMVSANARGFYDNLPNKKIHDDYLEKPLQLDALLEKISALLSIDWVYQTNTEHATNDTQTKRGKVRGTENSKSATETSSTSLNESLAQLIQLAKIGHLNDLLGCLNNIESAEQLPPETINRLRQLAQRFAFSELIEFVQFQVQSDQTP